MDGFRLADVELERLGRRDRKGAPDTFDAAGYAALLRRVREDPDEVVYAPAFERDIEQRIAGGIPIALRMSTDLRDRIYTISRDTTNPVGSFSN
jgi:pantothenate kinase